MSPSSGRRDYSGRHTTTLSPHHGSRLSSAALMPIPQARESASPPPPPPLPPPSHLPEISAGRDPGWQWGNDPNANDFGRPAIVRPGSSLLGPRLRLCPELDHTSTRHLSEPYCTSGPTSCEILPTNVAMSQRDASRSHDRSSLPGNAELVGERDLRRREMELSSHSYDKHLVNRIGGPSTPKRQSLPYTPTAVAESGAWEPNSAERRKSSVWSASMPERRHLSVDSNSTHRRTSSGGASPRATMPWAEHSLADRSRLHPSRPESLAGSGYDHFMATNNVPHGTEGVHASVLHLRDYSPGSPKAGTKRRASSPPRDSEDRLLLGGVSGVHDVLSRVPSHPLSPKPCPRPRFHPNTSSCSSASSAGPRHGSLGSSMGMASGASSATSYTSAGRLSPPLLLVDTHTATQHHRTHSDTTTSGTGLLSSTESLLHSPRDGLSQTHGTYMCDCCPKKPKKFKTEDEMRLHENEKQYTCMYCSKRFKNKNEAERHQNSLHLRLHAWSCAALSGPEAAFHTSSPTNDTDACGYCGQEFSNPPRWDIRADHLNHVHKFGECNQSKKFYRADHFRQHLKHSHRGTGGKWTNILESACMMDEPMPEKRKTTSVTSTPTGQTPPALVVAAPGLPSGPGPPTVSVTLGQSHDR